MSRLGERLSAIEARSPVAVRWHMAVALPSETREAIRNRMGLCETDNIFVYRLVSPNAQPE